MKKVPLAPPLAIRSLFRCMVRHCHHLDTPLAVKTLREIKKQFRRRRKLARIGHIRVAFAVEQDLRDACIGKMSLESIYSRYKKDEQDVQVEPHRDLERNAVGRMMLWRQHEPRRFDEFNAPPIDADSLRAVKRRAKLSSTRRNYLLSLGLEQSIKRENMDVEAIDTVLAPAWESSKLSPTPNTVRKVEVKTVVRSGGELSLLRIQGIPSRMRGFRQHLARVEPEIHVDIAKADHQIALADLYAQEPDLQALGFGEWTTTLREWRQSLYKHRQELHLRLEVQRRILIRRQAELQNQWAWRHRRTEWLSEQRAPKKLRLIEL